jgi:type IV pilus assembly protein PilO
MNLRQPYMQKGIAAIALVGVLVWLIFFTPYLPFSMKRTSGELAKQRDELQTIGGELQRAKTLVESIPRLRSELAQMESKWAALQSLLPKATEMSSLLAEVTASGLKSGVQFTLFEPQGPTLGDLYTRYPIKVSVTGGYHQVGSFFDNLCNMDRLVGISDVKLVQFEKGQTATTVEATAIVTAYTYNEDSRRAEQPQATKQGADKATKK